MLIQVPQQTVLTARIPAAVTVAVYRHITFNDFRAEYGTKYVVRGWAVTDMSGADDAGAGNGGPLTLVAFGPSTRSPIAAEVPFVGRLRGDVEIISGVDLPIGNAGGLQGGSDSKHDLFYHLRPGWTLAVVFSGGKPPNQAQISVILDTTKDEEEHHRA